MKYPDQFSRSRNKSVWCKDCCSQNAARWRNNNRERVRAHDRARSIERSKDADYREWQRLYRLLTKYRLTAEDFEMLWDYQDGRCAGCGGEFGRGKEGLHVDHDHATGQVRGLLCAPCNTAIGLCRDSGVRLRQLAAYLEVPPAPLLLGEAHPAVKIPA
jgi:hypothetical protein